MSNLRVACAAVLAVLAPLLSVASPPVSAAPPGFCGLDWAGQQKYVWDGSTGDDLWGTPQNWEGGQVPDLLDAENGYVCIDAAADEDPADDVVHMVPPARNLDPDQVADATSAMLQAIDVSSGTLSINRTGKLYLYGDQATRPSIIRPDARLELTMGTLGGNGRLNMHGEMVWTAAQFSSSTMKSSCTGIAGDNPGDPPGPPDTLPMFCPPAAEDPAGAGRLVVGGSLTVRGGVFDADGDLVDDGTPRGVNLVQRYGLVVADGGAVHVAGSAFIAQGHTASIEVRNGGDWFFDGDGDVVEGSFEGTPSGPLPRFASEGTVTKTAGAGASTIDTSYSGGGAVVVERGSLTTPGGFPVQVSATAGDSIGTWDCYQHGAGFTSPGCAFDNDDDTSVTTATDQQAAQLTVPSSAGADTRVLVRETGDMSAGDLQPQIEIASTGLEPDEVTRVAFEFSNKITGLPEKAEMRIFRRAGPANWREVPPCRDDLASPFPRGVTACVRGNPRDRADDKAVRLAVLTTTPRGRWVLRNRRGAPPELVRRVAVKDNGTFDYLGLEDPPNWEWFSRLDMSSPDGSHCGDRRDNSWTVHRTLLAPASEDDHAVGWWPSATGEARGFEVPVGDIADVGAFAPRLRVESGAVRGYVRLVRRETGSVTWEGRAEVLPGDLEPIVGDAPWHRVQGAVLDYSWQRMVSGVPDGAPVTATIEDFLAMYANPKIAAAPDTVGVAFGCAGEHVFVNELTVDKLTTEALVHWDLEAPPAFIRSPGLDLGTDCQLTRNTWPNVVRRKVEVQEGTRWVARVFDPVGPTLGAPFDSGVGPGLTRLTLPREPGQFILETSPTDNRRIGVIPEALRFKVVPVIKLLRITKTRKAYVGQRIVLKGAVEPRSVLQRPLPIKLWIARPGTRKLSPAEPRRTEVSVRDGVVTARYRASSPGRYYLALRYTREGTLSVAMSNRAAFTEVKRRPKVDQGQTDDTSYIADDTYVNEDNSHSTSSNFGVRREVSARATCEFHVNRR